VIDNQGANVAAYPATSGYWQGDDAKWVKSWAKGRGGVLITGIKLTHVQSTYLLKKPR
jgi:hypothetical protein